MKTLTAFYFTGTGNTRYITEYLLGQLSRTYRTEKYELTKAENAREKLENADVVLLAFPIYGSSPPIPMRRFVHKYGTIWNKKEVILVETQYFYSGDGAASLGRTVQKYGGKIIGAEMFNMPNNLSDCKIFAVRNGAEAEKILAKAKKRADRFAARLLDGNAGLRGFSPFSHAVGYFSQRKFWRKREAEKQRKLKIDPARCVGCGLCVKHCPVGNFDLKDKKSIPLGKCVMCYRCVNLCPCRAISLIGSAPPEKQYKGPM